MPKSQDYALGPRPGMEDSGAVVLHRADCPIVRAQADAGLPVMTMMGCRHDHRALDVERCHCLEDA